MKIVCEKNILMNAIKVVENAVSLKNTLPILSNILIKAIDNNVILIGTDLELTIKHFFRTTIEEEGSITVSAKKISNIVRELPEGNVSLYTEDNVLIVSCDKLLFKIKGLKEEEFPVFPTFKQDKNINIKIKTIIEMINKTIYAVSNDEIRYVLNGLFLSIENNNIKMVSTDGHRLSYFFNNLDSDFSGETKIVIPKKILHELSRISDMIEDKEKNLEIKISENQILFALDSVVLISRLIEGQFPDYEKVIPKNLVYKVKINRHQILDATRRIAIITNIKTATIKYHLLSDNLEIFAINPEEGEAKEMIPVQEYKGEEVTIGYNYHYIMDILKIIDTDEIYLEFTKPLTPGIIKPFDKENFINVIMPMKIENNI